MNGFVVLLCHGMDDIPVGLFATEQEAIDFGLTVDPMPTPEITDLIERDATTPINVQFVEFVDGVPTRMVIIKDFDDEESDEESESK